MPYRLGHLDALEAEAIAISREAVAQLERPVFLFSGGKDSNVLLRIAEKAFGPGRIPVPVMHIDTGHNFPEVLVFRDRRVTELGVRLIIRCVQDSIDQGRIPAQAARSASRNRLQSVTLMDAIKEFRFDAVFGGGRRDEDRARAKERVFSIRDEIGQWNPRNQRPELWDLYNGLTQPGEHLRIFPLSNWTELDIWYYIRREGLDLPVIYFAHRRDVIERDGMLLTASPLLPLLRGESVANVEVRFRTVGDMTCTAATRSTARTVDAVIAEIAESDISERGASRADDRFSDAAMEDRKREGYF